MTISWRSSIRGKLTAVIMLTCTTAVLLAGVGFVLQDVVDEREQLDAQITSFGRLIAATSEAALTFNDRKTAEEALSVLRTKPSFIAGCIYTERGVPFAKYSSVPVAALPLTLRSLKIVQGDGRVELFLPIMRDGERVGTVYIASDLRDLHARMTEDAKYFAVILTVCLLVAFVISSRLQGRISGPIVDLARVARLVSNEKNFSIRAPHLTSKESDEIGNLITGFNDMLAEIEQRDDRLLLIQDHLEKTVACRTEELTVANEELLEAKNAAEKVAEINAQLARQSALILNSTSEGILGVDLDNRVTFLNPAAGEMLGMTLSDLDGKTIHESIHHSHADGTPWPEVECSNTLEMRRGQSLEMTDDTFWRRDGTSFPVEYSTRPMFDDDGVQVGAVVIFRDVTERRAVDRLKSEFVSTVSHELRTPLTSIRGALGLLGSGLLGPIAEKGERMLEIAISNTDRLVRLINDMLDLERIGSGKVELARAPVDANAVMMQASEGLQSMADEAGVRLVVEQVSGTMFGDADRIIQTLTNLIGNAIKFSPRDTTVTLSGSSRDSDFLFCVADQGRGVPEQKLKTIFERFSQVDASDSRDKGGSGLGLAICLSIVTAHGGRIWVEDNKPVGSRFQFTIPLAVAVTATATAMHAPKSRTILVCQNDSSLIASILQGCGFGVVTAASPAGAMALATSLQPDAIVLDVADGSDCRQVVEILKSTAETRDIPVVVVSTELRGSCEPCVATIVGWVQKPLVSEELMSAIDLACDAPSILLVEDDDDLARVMTTALQSHGLRTFHAVRGREAIRLCRQHEPSLIVLDLGLPDMDGFAVVASLRESASLGRVPMIVYSALDVGSADRSRLRLGPTEFLTKSRCSLADFEAHVVRLLETVIRKKEEGQHAA